MSKKGSFDLKVGLAEMLKGGVIMDVMNVDQAKIAEEAGHFDLADIANGISEKMIARHPHIFNEDTDRPTAERQRQIWEEIKAADRVAQGETGVLDGIAVGLSPMLRALKLQKRAASVGFDWPDFRQLREKLLEEAAELEVELTASTIDQHKVIEEVGDILFVAVNIARKAGVDPETALLSCNKKFENRFKCSIYSKRISHY